MDEATEQKFGVVDDRLEHLERRADALEGKRAKREARRFNWAMVALFLAELVVLVAEAPDLLHALARFFGHA